MSRNTASPSIAATPINIQQARWVNRVLGMLIAVVGKESILGLILGQTRLEIRSLLQSAAEPDSPPPGNRWFLCN